MYDPIANSWTVVASLKTARAYHTATLLPGGQVLVTGGFYSVPLSSAEVYDPNAVYKYHLLMPIVLGKR
jgi:hypothetical protein